MEVETKGTQFKPLKSVHGDSGRRQKRRKVADRWAKWIVAASGFAIIASILAILIFILIEIMPLFNPASIKRLASYEAEDLLAAPDSLSGDVIALGLEENQEVGYVLSRNGFVRFFSVGDGVPRESFVLDDIANQEITSVWQSLNNSQLLLGTSAGKALFVEIAYHTRFFEGSRSYRPEFSRREIFTIDDTGRSLKQVALAGNPGESVAIAAITAAGEVRVFIRNREESFLGDAQIDSSYHTIKPIWTGQPRSIALDGASRNLYVGSSDGKIYHWVISPDDGPEFVSVARSADEKTAITGLAFLIGDRSLVVGDAAGRTSVWFLVRDNTAKIGWRLTKIRDMATHPAAVTTLAASARGKGFISGDVDGNLLLQYSTSERKLAEFEMPDHASAAFVAYAPKTNGALTLSGYGSVTQWKIDNPHPEASFEAFFGKVWYEGYEEPDFVWQSTGGTDDFEPKLSLVPLIFGSFKGTLYALIIAIPLAIFAAIFTSQFMHPRFRNYVKPSVEIMAALPSVVLGFLAGLWLAPRIEQIIPAMLSMFIVLPLLIVGSALLWNNLPRIFRAKFRHGIEAFLLIPVIILGIWLCIEVNGVFEQVFFNGDFKVWLYESMGMSYDQRNALVVGFAMGFAVIPIIYTISEDALSNVPKALISGSLALGATRWQTALKVVVPTAAAGIFSAIMIGLGRAVGETMIVLMATGNTPIMDWNIFNGFRTLSANIAVEIPEAPLGGTLYRVLFLSAFLLFIITFIVNTGAELVRQRLREKYQKL